MKKYILGISSLLLLSFNWNIGNAQNATCTRLQEELNKTEEKLVGIEARKFTYEDFFSLMDNPNSLTETSIPEEIATAEYRVRGLQRKITEGDNSPETAAELKSYQSRLKLLALRGSRSYDKNTFFKDPSYLEQEKIFNKLKSEELALKVEVVRIEQSMKSYNCEIKKKSDGMDDIDDNIIDKPKDEKDKTGDNHQEIVANTKCWPGSYAAWNEQTQKVECRCPSGKTWNDTKTACIDLPGSNTSGSDYSKLSGNWNWISGAPGSGPIMQLTVTNGGVSGRSWILEEYNLALRITGGSYDAATKRLSVTYLRESASKPTGKANFDFTENSANYILTGTWRHDDGSSSGTWVMTKKK